MAKGTVTNEIQYRGFNTVRMNPGDSYDCYEFFVKAGDYISHSFAIYSVNPLAGATRARTRFIGANGLTISTSSHTVATTGGTFDEIAIEGVPVPTGARLGRLELLSPSGTYWVAMPKSEDGEKVTPYSQNFSGQMTYITPTGVYTGTIQAQQVSLADGSGLEESMTTINSQVINMTSSISSLNADVTTIQAGQAEFVKVSDIDGSSSTTIIDGGTIKTGTITTSGGGAWFDLDKPEIVMEGELADLSITPGNPLKLMDKNGKFIGGVGVADGILGLVAGALTNDPNMNTYVTVGYPAEGGFGISIYEENYPDVYMGRFEAAGSVGILLDDVARLRIEPNGNTFLQNAENSHAIGADSTGPYFVKNGVKSYL